MQDFVKSRESATTWRTLWVELDQMAAPNYRTGPNYDGFDPTKEYAGTTTDANDNPISGLWSTLEIANEPGDFDLVFQPPKPDISILTTAMAAACVLVYGINGGAGTAAPNWITGDSASLHPGLWDSTTPFVHNTSSNVNDPTGLVEISKKCRDVNKNNVDFWCLHAIGGYEEADQCDGDQDGDVFVYGISIRDSAIFMVYNETIRDKMSLRTRSSFPPPPVGWGETEFRQLVTFHETLHKFGFFDGSADGPIMDVSTWANAKTLSPDLMKLKEEQIKKVQARDYPH